ncbi:hypothetical protein BDN72DRAFT_264750 [Pluteus cervinus]|uniref:Uncharacterized protein n=1 Tax=Pluteus cervinus TaxID=181527 RepID=A0ACD3AFP0_9AGAR|nr:hypothetical protein BDN72DRAFT_264750 [Pluteus cervinus]
MSSKHPHNAQHNLGPQTPFNPIPYFNSHGEIVYSEQWDARAQQVPIAFPALSTSKPFFTAPICRRFGSRGQPRLCMHYACGTTLPLDYSHPLCVHCQAAASLPHSPPHAHVSTTQPSALPAEQSRPKSNTHAVARKLPPPAAEKVQQVDAIHDATMKEIELGYPEEEKFLPPPQISNGTGPLISAEPSYLPGIPFPKPTQGVIIRTCSNKGCDRLVQHDSKSARCIRCLRKAWSTYNRSCDAPIRPTQELAKPPEVLRTDTFHSPQLSSGTFPTTDFTKGTPEAQTIPDSELYRTMPAMSKNVIESDHDNLQQNESRLSPRQDVEFSNLNDSTSSCDEEPLSLVMEKRAIDAKVTVPTRLTIRLPLHAIRAALAIPRCTFGHCQAELPIGYRWKCCVLCRAWRRLHQNRRSQMKGKRREPDYRDIASTKSGGDTAGMTVIPGARLCPVRQCAHIIPPASDYKWKRCHFCRRDGAEPIGVDDESTEQTPTWKTAIPKSKKHCVNQDCGYLINAYDSASVCSQCQRRLAEQKESVCPTPISAKAFPEYQSLSTLAVTLRNYLNQFFEAQSVYNIYGTLNTPRNPTKFIFTGEFSMVALGFEVVQKRDESIQAIIATRKEIERVCSLSFHRKSLVTLQHDSITMKFSCPCIRPISGEGILPQPPPPREMQGELEISLLPDRSHRFFPGHRHLLRFSLVG